MASLLDRKKAHWIGRKVLVSQDIFWPILYEETLRMRRGKGMNGGKIRAGHFCLFRFSHCHFIDP